MGPHPAVAAVRRAVRDCLSAFEPGDLVLAACSGGCDSVALAAALAFEAPKAGLIAGGVTVDHGLQDGSLAQARWVVEIMTGLGLDPVLSVAVEVARPGGANPAGYPGPEAAARNARYQALDQAAEQTGAVAVLLGHTMDDQAETVLLGLCRGSGARSLAGMAPVSGRYRRPLLDLRRDQTKVACDALSLRPWDDPHNDDPAFTRVRVRRLMPSLEQALGPGVAQALARTARLLRADDEALDALAAAAADRIAAGATGTAADEGTDGDGAGHRDRGYDNGLDAAALGALPAAIRLRVLRQAAITAGCPPGSLSERHVTSLDRLVTGWHGQRWTDLPGGVRCQRRYGRLLFSTPGSPGVASPASRPEVPGGCRPTTSAPR
jgi:tRNA(Ile)-lysidine synthase